MVRMLLGISLIVGLLAFSACSASNTTDVIQTVEPAKVADDPARENVPAEEVVVEEPAPVKDLSQDSKPPSPLQIGGLVGNEAPEFQGISNWINSEPLTMEDLRGKVVLIDFWTYTCYNCINTMPYLRDWHDKYADKGLVIVGVHSPEFDHEKPYENVVDATIRHELKYPVAQDNDFKTWRSYNNRYWPAEYLIDQNGVVRYRHFGEGAYEETENLIRDLLEETGADLS